MEGGVDPTIELLELFNKYCNSEKGTNDLIEEDYSPVRIVSLDSFRSGSYALIVIVTMENEQKRIIKIEGEFPIGDPPLEDQRKEYKIHSRVNRISGDISPKLYFFKCITENEDLATMLHNFSILELSRSDSLLADMKSLHLLLEEGKNVAISLTMMDYIEGLTLAEMIERKPGKEIIPILEDFRKKLNILHNNHIYHCDLHENNIIVVGGTVRIIDFGTAIIMEQGVDLIWEENSEKCGEAWSWNTAVRDMRYPQSLVNQLCGEGGQIPCVISPVSIKQLSDLMGSQGGGYRKRKTKKRKNKKRTKKRKRTKKTKKNKKRTKKRIKKRTKKSYFKG